MKTKHTLKELSLLTDISIRNIRFYIQNEIVDKPFGQNKGAYYTQTHLDQLMMIKKYKDAGVSLERISQIIKNKEQNLSIDYQTKQGSVEILSRIHLMQGIELVINPEISKFTQRDVRKLSEMILKNIETIEEEKKNEKE